MKKTVLISILVLFCLIGACAESSVVMLRNNGPLRIADDKGGVTWSITVPEGTVLPLAEKEPVTKDLVTSSGTTPNVSFYHVSYKSKEYYAAASEVVVSDTPSILWEDAVLYTKPCLSDFRNAYLEFGTMVVTGNQTVDNGISFTEVFFYDTTSGAGVVKTRYVLSSKISNNAKDVKALQMLAKADEETDRDLKLELMSNALSLEMSTRIRDYLEEKAEEMFSLADTAE